MSNYYNPHRSASWNYGGNNWKLSRSKIGLFMECPRCFYLDNKRGVKRPPGFPFNLNTAVDTLLKKEFDLHRAKNKAHPLMKKYKLDLIPFAHDMMDEWRDNFKGVRYAHQPTGFIVTGAIDDIWTDAKGALYVVDYKSTSKDAEITALDQEWQDGYKRQMEVYQWLLRRNGHEVSNTGYFVYCNGRTDKEAFDGQLEFDVTVIPYEGDDAWVEKTLVKIKKCLECTKTPLAGKDCDYCAYREAVGKVLKYK